MATKKIKIVALSHSPSVGGAELALNSLMGSTKGLIDWTLVVIGKAEIDSSVVSNASKVYRLDLPWWCHEAHDEPPKINTQHANKQLHKLTKIAQEADLLLTNTITVPWLGFISAKVGKPHIWYIHEYGDSDHNLNFILGYKKSLEYISLLSSRVLTISTAVSKHLQQVVPSDQIDIIHQSVNLSSLLELEPARIDKKGFSLLCLGALKPSKGQGIAAEAVAGMPTDYLISLDILGPIADPTYFKTFKKDSRIHIRPGRYNPPSDIAKHNVLLVTSDNEALGRVTLEGLAAGRLVIGYDCESTRELLSDGRGLLYSPNTPEALRSTIMENAEGFATSVFSAASNRKFVAEMYGHKRESSDFIKSYEKAIASERELHRSDLLENYFDALRQQSLLQTRMKEKRTQLYRKLLELIPKRIKTKVKMLISR